MELGELAGLRKVTRRDDLDAIKDLLTDPVITVRHLYDREPTDHVRTWGWIGSANPGVTFSNDDGGAFRFIPVPVTKRPEQHPNIQVPTILNIMWWQALVGVKNGKYREELPEELKVEHARHLDQHRTDSDAKVFVDEMLEELKDPALIPVAPVRARITDHNKENRSNLRPRSVESELVSREPAWEKDRGAKGKWVWKRKNAQDLLSENSNG